MIKAQGIALVQVLIITAILSIIAIYITKSAKMQIQIATWADDKSQAYILAHSAQNKLLYELLTSPWQVNRQPHSLSANWNFYSKPFLLQPGVMVALQDQAGLIDMHFPIKDILHQRLLVAGLSENQANEAVDSLLDWQDSDSIRRRFGNESADIRRNGPIADIREWLLQKTLTEQQFANVRQDLSIAGAGHLNLMTSSKALLTAATNESVADEIVRLRDNGNLDRDKMEKLTANLEDDNLFNAVSNKQRITIFANYGEAAIKRTLHVELFPYSVRNNHAYYIMQSEGN